MKSYIFYIMVGFLLLITVLVSTETKGEIAPVESLDNVVAAGQPGITVVGEMRTVDTVANPRLWGKGRPGTRRYGTVGIESGLCMAGSIDYGLSLTIVDWGSTADACPAGTWVCSIEDLESGGAPFGNCDTARPDTTSDQITCSGVSLNGVVPKRLFS